MLIVLRIWFNCRIYYKLALIKTHQNQILVLMLILRTWLGLLGKFVLQIKKIRDGESVVIGNIQNKRSSSVNVGLRFDKRLKDIFNSASKEFQGVDLVYADKTVNSGDDEWTFRSKKSGFKYVAKLEDFEWLAKYQRGEIKPIGPHDLITVLVRYNYDSYHGKTTRPFDAVITKVERVDYEQEQLVRNLF